MGEEEKQGLRWRSGTGSELTLLPFLPRPHYRQSPPRSGPCRKLLQQVSGSRSLTRWIVSWLTLALPRSQSGAKMTDMLQKKLGIPS